ncbi:hypothetical protein K466DRAFT_366349 [Polyporus arcularius HHB13444]|uniref:Uncharacterized protein n=1 Tax=Polyporus arcularius HHB13444 TaxID=1314778 RepID=A0A5C3NWU7_9APHY|nr:hypothetical protein K466DRAFT_366349 [Polyporus arcularius HHB13444]
MRTASLMLPPTRRVTSSVTLDRPLSTQLMLLMPLMRSGPTSDAPALYHRRFSLLGHNSRFGRGCGSRSQGKPIFVTPGSHRERPTSLMAVAPTGSTDCHDPAALQDAVSPDRKCQKPLQRSAKDCLHGSASHASPNPLQRLAIRPHQTPQ